MVAGPQPRRDDLNQRDIGQIKDEIAEGETPDAKTESTARGHHSCAPFLATPPPSSWFVERRIVRLTEQCFANRGENVIVVIVPDIKG